MSRLIDATELNGYKFGLISTYAQELFRDTINNAPTIKVIPLDKIKQAREEIDDLDRHFDNDYFSSNNDAMFKCSEVLAILDKLIESEE